MGRLGRAPGFARRGGAVLLDGLLDPPGSERTRRTVNACRGPNSTGPGYRIAPMTQPPAPAIRMPASTFRAWGVPGLGTWKAQMPMLALTSRLSWAMVKPVPVPTRATRPSRVRSPMPNRTPGAELRGRGPQAQPGRLPAGRARARAAPRIPMASGKLLTCAGTAAHCAGTK